MMKSGRTIWPSCLPERYRPKAWPARKAASKSRSNCRNPCRSSSRAWRLRPPAASSANVMELIASSSASPQRYKACEQVLCSGWVGSSVKGTERIWLAGGIEPCNDDGRVHQDHGRVLLSSSTPEILPFQAPARARMWRCIALAAPAFGLANTPSPRSSQERRVPVVMPARLRRASGMVVVPLLVTFVSVFI